MVGSQSRQQRSMVANRANTTEVEPKRGAIELLGRVNWVCCRKRSFPTPYVYRSGPQAYLYAVLTLCIFTPIGCRRFIAHQENNFRLHAVSRLLTATVLDDFGGNDLQRLATSPQMKTLLTRGVKQASGGTHGFELSRST